MSDCFHCGLAVPPGSSFSGSINGATRQFCCPGCQAVARAIVDGGLASFYEYRTQTSERPEAGVGGFAVYDLEAIQTEFVQVLADGQRRAGLLLSGITCAACVWLIEQHLRRLPGLTAVSVNANTHRAHVTWDPAQLTLGQIMAALAAIGYQPQPATEDRQHLLYQQEQRQALMRLAVAGFGMMQVGMFAIVLYAGAIQGISETWEHLFRLVSFVVATPVVFFSARSFFTGAWRALRTRHLTMDVPVAIAIGGSYLASVWATVFGGGEVYFDAVSMFTFFLLWGRYLEMRARHRNSLATGRLAQLLPLTAERWDAAAQVYTAIPIKQVAVGDRLLISAGATIPCDGRVLEGESGVVEALLTGEPEPVLKRRDSLVTAGTLNTDNPLHIEVEAVGAATRLSAIEHLVEQAEQDKPRQVATADRLAGVFVGTVLVVACAVFGIWYVISPADAFWITLSVLVVTCPCALSLAAPAALTAALAELRTRGLLVTRGHVLETLPDITRVIFDKTGTLTLGEPQVVAVQLLGSASREQVLGMAAALESGSAHPLARAFRPFAGSCFASSQAQYHGLGVEGTVAARRCRLGRPVFVAELLDSEPVLPSGSGQWLLLAREGEALAWIGLADCLRDSAAAAVNAIRARGIKVELLSGDSSAAGAELARSLNLDACLTGVAPADKLARVQALQAQGEKILMVGDGINDIPVLSGADVSVAMGSATDLAQTRADSILLSGDLQVLDQAFDCALLTRRIIRQNLTWARLYNGLALPFAAMGWVPPYAAAVGMSLSSLMVVANALRIHKAGAGTRGCLDCSVPAAVPRTAQV